MQRYSSFGALFAAPFLMATLSLAAPAQAQESELPQALIVPLSLKYREQYISQLLMPVRRQGQDDMYIDQPLIDRLRQEAIVAKQNSLLQKEMRRDKDGDGFISTEEIEASLPRRVKQVQGMETEHDVNRRIKAEVQKILSTDTDKDGRISLAEANAFAKERAQLMGNRPDGQLSKLLALDPNQDGKLTARELITLGNNTFSHFDKNGDDIIDDEEMKAAKATMNAAVRNAAIRVNADQAVYCKPPAASAKDEIILVSGYEGDAISSVSVAGMDRPTSTARMVIEKGTAPLYIFATTYDPLVWRVEGDVKRISQFVLVAQHTNSGVGVVGVAKSKVSFLPPGACFKYFSKPDDGAARQGKAILEGLLKKPVSKVAAAYNINTIALPSGAMPKNNNRARNGVVIVKGPDRYLLENGQITNLTAKTAENQPTDSKADANTVAALKRFTPSGVIKIDEKAVIASAQAQAYDVLPQEAGLIQLMEEGKVERLSDGVYLIKKPIARFPAGLAGAHSVKFMLGKGIPMPAGNPGHSCVITEETELPLSKAGIRCR